MCERERQKERRRKRDDDSGDDEEGVMDVLGGGVAKVLRGARYSV